MTLTSRLRAPLVGSPLRPATAQADLDRATTVLVQRQWDGWRTTSVRLSDLHDVHWHQPAHAPQPLLHAYVLCTEVATRELPHDCVPATVPHRVRVCILKIHTQPGTYSTLKARADEAARRSAGGPARAALR
jgi:hypothetical protein